MAEEQNMLEKVETLKNLLVDRATGGFPAEAEYQQLRSELIGHSLTKDKLPRLVRTCRSLDEFWGFIQPRFAHYRERREFLREEFEPILTFLEQTNTTPSDGTVTETLAHLDSTSVQNVWQKALERRATDPEGAITAARTLLEAVCKHILDEGSVHYDEGADLPKLYRLVASHLNLSPSQHTEQLFKQILGGCHAVVDGLGALRNKLSDAHGRGKTTVHPAPRHAELAVNLAGTVATFLVATWERHTT